MTPFHQFHWRHYFKYAGIAVIFYCACVLFYCRDVTFSETWVLFTGNLLFLVVISASLFSFNKHRRNNASTVSMLAAGHITTLTAIVISCLACFIILLIYIPGFLGTPHRLLHDEPVNIVRGKTNGLVFIIFMSTTMGNFVAGSSASILFSFTLKSNQTKESETSELSDL